MTEMKSYKFWIILLCLIPGMAVCAQSIKTEQLIYECYSTNQLNLDENRLPENYRGNNLGLTLSEIQSRENLEKDEFETSVQFRNRAEAAQVSPIRGTLFVTSNFAFLVDAAFQYDADLQIMSATIDFAKREIFPDVWWASPARTPCSERPISKLRGNPLKFVGFSKNLNIRSVWHASFEVKIQDARELKPRLRTLLIAKLVRENSRYVSDSRSEPSLAVELKQIWIYDLATGNVLRKFDFSSENLRRPRPEYADEIDKAKGLMGVGKFDEAISILNAVLRKEPFSSNSYVLLGEIYIGRHDFDKAIDSFKTAIFYDNTLIEAHIYLGNLYLERVDCPKARTYAASAMEIDSENTDALALRRHIERCSR